MQDGQIEITLSEGRESDGTFEMPIGTEYIIRFENHGSVKCKFSCRKNGANMLEDADGNTYSGTLKPGELETMSSPFFTPKNFTFQGGVDSIEVEIFFALPMTKEEFGMRGLTWDEDVVNGYKIDESDGTAYEDSASHSFSLSITE